MDEICEIDKIDRLFKKNEEKIEHSKKVIDNNEFIMNILGLNCIIALFIFFTNNIEIDIFLFFVLQAFQVLQVLTFGLLIIWPLMKKFEENNLILLIVFFVPTALAILNMNIEFISWMCFSLIGLIIASLIAIYYLIITPKENKELKKNMEKNLKLKKKESKIIEDILENNLKIKELNNYVTNNESHMKKRKKILDLFVEKEKDLLTVDSLLEKEYNSILNL